MDESLVAQYPDLERNHFWWATRRALATELVTGLAGDSDVRVLDVGCGSGMTAAAIANHGATVVGVDLETHGSNDASGVEFIEGDYLALADGLGEFDIVLALDAIEHFEDEAQVFKALAGNIVPGGHLLVTVPAYEFLWSSHDDTNQHYRRYTVGRIRRALTDAGLEVDRLGHLFMLLTLPKALLTAWERMRRKHAPTGTDVTGWSNVAAARYFSAETRLAIVRTNFLPFGTSVVAVARRPIGR